MKVGQMKVRSNKSSMTLSDDKGVVPLRGETSREKAKFSNYDFCNNCHDYE